MAHTAANDASAAPTVTPIPMSDNDDSPPRVPGDRLGPALLGAAYCAVLTAPWMIGYGYGWKFLAAAAVFFVASMFAGSRKRIAEAAEEYEMELRDRHLLR